MIEFPELLRLIDERSAAFRTAVAAAPSLGTPVPSCPGWTLADLVRHLAEGRRKWAAIVAAGPATEPVATSVWEGADDVAAATGELLDALREAGPDRGCWTPWKAPGVTGAVARHQLQEIAVHTYDAQLTAGTPQPLPAEVALDGVPEFLARCCAGYGWTYAPATVDYETAEGPTWRLHLEPAGVRVTAHDSADPATATMRGTASDLVLALYARIPTDSLKLDGDRRVFTQLLEWDPDD